MKEIKNVNKWKDIPYSQTGRQESVYPISRHYIDIVIRLHGISGEIDTLMNRTKQRTQKYPHTNTTN